MAVGVGGGQFMVHALRTGKGPQGHEQEDETDRQAASTVICDTHGNHYSVRHTTVLKNLSNKTHNSQICFVYSSIG